MKCSRRSPRTNLQLRTRTLIPNRALLALIQDWRQHTESPSGSVTSNAEASQASAPPQMLQLQLPVESAAPGSAPQVRSLQRCRNLNQEDNCEDGLTIRKLRLFKETRRSHSSSMNCYQMPDAELTPNCRYGRRTRQPILRPVCLPQLPRAGCGRTCWSGAPCTPRPARPLRPHLAHAVARGTPVAVMEGCSASR